MNVQQHLSHELRERFQIVVDQFGNHHDLLMSGGMAVVILIATTAFLFFMQRNFWESAARIGGKRQQWLSGREDINKSHGQVKARSIWDFNKKNNSASTSKSKEQTTPGKPFGSTYYYAHNNPNACGGYKDGLRMEDYTMNQPRLLSRDGKPVEESTTDAQDSFDNAVPDQQQRSFVQPPNKAIIRRDTNAILITKYQWDDPGDYNGIAHIRIDTLPGKGGTDIIQWQDIPVKEISAKLIGDGLEVKVKAESGETYLLSIPALYGQAAAVRAFVKPKRLVVRLWKVKSMLSVLDYGTSNLKPWPHLRKI